MENKNVLLRITNLKQYFPIKGGRFVKANDGITIDIYEGETFGLVGESGCGKSTLGRTLLQLYRQTDGRSVYYGRTLADVAPRYFDETIRSVNKRRRQCYELKAAYDAKLKEYEAMPDEVAGEDGTTVENVAKFKMAEEVANAKRTMDNAYTDIVSIFGGFMVVGDLSTATQLYMRLARSFRKAAKLRLELAEANLNLSDAQFKYNNSENKSSGAASAIARYQDKVAACEAALDAAHAEVDAARAALDQERAKHADNPEFVALEELRDDGIDLARLTYEEMRQLRSDMQLIFQDPYSSLNPRMTVGQIVGEGMLAHGYFKKNNEQMQEAVLKVMESCGLAPYFVHRYPHQFSGGQRQRIGIARALGVYPKFVVCDEAVSALDVSIQSQIINLLQDLKEEQNLTYMFITHDLSVVKYISNRIGVMYLGTMVELAPSEEMFAHPMHPYTEALLNAIPTTDQRRELLILEGDIPSPVNPPKGCKFHTRCHYCTEICRHVTPELIEVRPEHFVACHHMLHAEDATMHVDEINQVEN
ncbi:MAG: ATP-binding cassette domain-containing protein [Clostridia bacterium]|nr:ATP-binding cassette domain-containing protein [Clostridia bacterium]